MDPPPSLRPLPAGIAAANLHLNCPDSIQTSSPRSQNGPELDELPQLPGGAKLRLMCSYGGHIIPRPHDKSLSYMGGETRLVVVDRNSTLATLCSRISLNLVHGRPFTLKYQFPNEELDSLVSIATDEDLENMIDEYDRISNPNSARIRLFLFFLKPETAASMGSLLDDTKSETWFVDALNGSGLLPRNLSDSATLVNLDNSINIIDLESKNFKQLDLQQLTPESPILENRSSSNSSLSPSMANLPPIRVRADQDRKNIGIEEQFAQLSFAQQKQDDGFETLAAAPGAVTPPPPMAMMADSACVACAYSAGTTRVSSDDERSDQGVQVSSRKPPLPIRPHAAAHYNLHSPDSLASDCSIASASSLSKHAYYQDNTNAQIQTQDSELQRQQLQPSQQQQQQLQPPQQQQQQQQQFMHTSMHYVPHPTTTPVPMSSYYQMYAPSGSHRPMDQQFVQYIMPVPRQQPSVGDATSASRPPKAAGYPAVNQYQQQQYVGFSQVQNPAQSIAVAPAGNSNYGYDYSTITNNPSHDQFYYAQPQAVSFAPQYQSMTPAAAAVALADAAKHLPSSNEQQFD